MKNKIICSLLFTALILCTSGCGNNSLSSSLSEQLESETVTETTTAKESTTTATEHITTTTTTSATAAQTTEPPTQEPTEGLREIVEAVCVEIGEGQFLEETYTVREGNGEFHVYENYADFIMHRAQNLPERWLGSISGEDDLIEKYRAILIEKMGSWYIDYVESEYVERDGVKIKFERRYPPYDVKYYEEYDVWYIVTNPPSGVREDGVPFDVIWDWPPYLLVRGEDGMILGAYM